MVKIGNKFLFKKGENSPLSKHFTTKEFECQCANDDCIDQIIECSLIEKLEAIRQEIAIPIKVTSGFRCTKHQEALRNSGTLTVVAKKSTHELGQAADIKAQMPIDELEKVCAKHFQSIGIAKTFLHCDLRTDKPKRRWAY